LYGGSLNKSCMRQNQSQTIYPDKRACEHSIEKKLKSRVTL